MSRCGCITDPVECAYAGGIRGLCQCLCHDGQAPRAALRADLARIAPDLEWVVSDMREVLTDGWGAVHAIERIDGAVIVWAAHERSGWTNRVLNASAYPTEDHFDWGFGDSGFDGVQGDLDASWAKVRAEVAEWLKSREEDDR